MSYTCLRETTPVARKEHKCIWCGQLIPVGERYHREHSIFDGRFQDHRWHNECWDAAQQFFRESHDNEFVVYENPRGREPDDWPETDD